MSASRKLQGGLTLLGALILSSIGGWAHRAAADEQPSSTTPALLGELRTLSQQLESVRGELAVARLQLDRANAVIGFSGHYLLPADLAEAINDIALAEGIEPGLAFRLVMVESRFDPQARSSAGAIGLTQILPSTARVYEPGLSTEQLYDRGTNLRLGFRYLRNLLERYDNDLEHALLAYNRGPAKVQELLKAGMDPRNGYSRSVMNGYRRPPPPAAE
jgi:soluble lytic murein transglycosylase-like protein